MPVRFTCLSCLRTLTAPDAAANKPVRCPRCNAPCVVPPASPAVARTRRAERVDADDDDVVLVARRRPQGPPLSAWLVVGGLTLAVVIAVGFVVVRAKRHLDREAGPAAAQGVRGFDGGPVRPVAGVGPVQPPERIEAPAWWFKQYADNLLAGDARYKGRVVDVRAEFDLKRDADGYYIPYMVAPTEGLHPSIIYYLDDRKAAGAAAVRPGEPIWVRGRCRGAVSSLGFRGVTLCVDDCEIIAHGPAAVRTHPDDR